MSRELINIRHALMNEWHTCEQKHRDSGDDWYAGVLSGIEVALSKVDLMIEHESESARREEVLS